jgi:hypothetical protein
MTTKTKTMIDWILTALVSFVFLGSAANKFFGGEEALQMAQHLGLDATTFRVIGVIEVLSVILFIIPRTGILGTLLLAAYMGGAISAHLTHNDPVIAPSVIAAFVWIVAVVRFPELRSRLLGNSKKQASPVYQ